ncbi:nucleoside-diphosphate sugar epimerase [Rhodoferax sp.]|uniref:nucleoside-diphosphate sugar epimerase n=1 Tax=Rhodoferax sp. TaxID=50421 RepID=UPI00374D807F
MGRRPLTLQHSKLFSHVVDFATLSALPGIGHVDDVFIALGTTLKVAGSQTAFRALDFEAIVALARVSKALGATKLGIVSALGANPSSRVFYNRVKGEMEQALSQLGYPVLIIARPSLLTGDRDALAQAARPAEKLGLFAMTLLKPLIPANYRPVAATQVARALLSTVHSTERGTRVLSSGEMQAVKSV